MQEEVKWLKVSLEIPSDGYEPISAGTKPTSQINPLAIQAMNEVGLDIQQTESQRYYRRYDEKF